MKEHSSLWASFGKEMRIEDDIMQDIHKEKQSDTDKLELVVGFWLQLSVNPSWDELLRVLEALELCDCVEKSKQFLLTDNQAIAKYKWKVSFLKRFILCSVSYV